jgi:Autographiviridae endonuclease VII
MTRSIEDMGSDELRTRETSRKWYLANREKVIQQSMQRHRDNPERRRAQQLKWARSDKGKKQKRLYFQRYRARLFGADFDSEMAKQRGLCLVCGCRLADGKFCVDHCHNTLKFRGILCTNCNLGIGHFRDDPVLMRKGANYVSNAAKAV